MADLNIALSITASDQASSKMKQVGGAAQGMGDKVQGAVGPAVAAAAAAGIALAGKYVLDFVNDSLEEFQTFETGMAEVFTVLPGLSEEAMGDLEMQALDAAASMGRLPEEVLPALYQALSAGVPASNVFEFLETANAAAIGGVTDLETAVDAISSVTNAYGEELVNAAEASDMMFTASALGKTTFEELGASLFQVVPTAASLKVGFGDISAALAVMTAQGVPTSVATTQLRQALVELSKEGGTAAATFERVSGVSFTQFIEQGGNLQEALALMAGEADRAGIPVSNLFSSVEAGNAALTLTGGATEAFVDAIKAMEESTGSTETAAAQFEDTMQRLEDTVNAQTSELKILVAQGLAPTKQAWLELKQILIEAAIESAKEAKTRRENFATWEDERDVQGDVIAQLEDYIAVNEVAIETSKGFADEQEAIWEALDTVNAKFDPVNGSLEDAAANSRALAFMLQLLQEGFSGTGAELGAAALAMLDYDERVADAAERTEQLHEQIGLVANVQANEAVAAAEDHAAAMAVATSQAELYAAGERELTYTTEASIAAAQAAVTADEALALSKQTVSEKFLEAAAAIDPLVAAYGLAESAVGAMVEVDGVWMTDHDAAAIAIQEANAAIGESYRQMAADAILAKQGVNEATIQMLIDMGLLTPEAAALKLEFAQNSDIILNQLVPAFEAGKITSEELNTAIGLLEDGSANTAESAIAMAQAMNDDVNPAFRAAKEEAIALETPIRNIKSAAEDAAGDYDINFNITQNGEVPATPGYQGSSGAGYQAPPDGYALGGYTGDGPQSEIAGVVHRGEYVIPPGIVDHWGVDGIESLLSGAAQEPVRIEPGRGGETGHAAAAVTLDMRGSTFYGLDDFERKLEAVAERVLGRYGQRANTALLTR